MILEAPLKDPWDLAEGKGGDGGYKDFLKLVMPSVWGTQTLLFVIVMLFFSSEAAATGQRHNRLLTLPASKNHWKK